MAQAALAGASGVFGAVGAMEEGRAGYIAGQYNASVADENARQARLQAAEDARRQEVDARKQLGSIKAAYGASGVVSSEGSALDVLQESARSAALDHLTIKHQGELRARAYESEAVIARMGGDAARTAGNWRAASSLTAGALSAADKAPRGGSSSARKPQRQPDEIA